MELSGPAGNSHGDSEATSQHCRELKQASPSQPRQRTAGDAKRVDTYARTASPAHENLRLSRRETGTALSSHSPVEGLPRKQHLRKRGKHKERETHSSGWQSPRKTAQQTTAPSTQPVESLNYYEGLFIFIGTSLIFSI